MRRKVVLVILLVIIVGLFLGLGYQQGFLDRAFDTEGRYDPSELTDMGVIYSNRSDITSFNEGYSESNNCPWGFIHNGVDYFFANDSNVIAAAPGIVETIDLNDWGPEAAHRYTINVGIRFNSTVTVMYAFEPWTNSTLDQDQQLSMFSFEVGTWIARGNIIAEFLKSGDGAHIHFGVVQDGVWRDPTQYMSTDGYNELLGLIHDYHPTWEVSYP
ncbi:MAG: M23 family metallopeptidase [Promethearchaeota archaeon]